MPIKPEDWAPIEVVTLEAAAAQAVRSSANALVIAGPGAGKTELLAQRACYLLQTGLCRPSRRILAISFKRDAARNLHDRVHKRCGADATRSFESRTFDSFAKGLLDRFRPALPARWRPTSDYQLNLELGERSISDVLSTIPEAHGGLSTAQLASLPTSAMYRSDFVGIPLVDDPTAPQTVSARAAEALWNFLLHHGASSMLNLQMIGRLSELLLRTNPKILTALRATYQYVFLDEFQDTTNIQYELTRTAFLDSESVLTAVGDNKQRIMGWAGALNDSFEKFQRDFHVVQPIRLVNNYRSAPGLVRILGVLTAELDQAAAAPVAAGGAVGGECRVLLFSSHERESEWLAETVERWIVNEGLLPREICILVRMRPDDYTDSLQQALRERGIEARVESELQDVLSEPISTLVLDLLKLAARRQAPDSRERVLDLLIEWSGQEEESIHYRCEQTLAGFLKQLRNDLSSAARTPEAMADLLSRIVAFLGKGRVATSFTQYAQGDLFDKTVAKLAEVIAEYRVDREWDATIAAVEGVGSVPIMTMHKSKGLEYHTVVFVGLEDDALWGYREGPAEETRGFFVAFSRAKQRVFFTFCGARPRRAGESPRLQQRRQINRLYALLESAGVVPEEIGQ